MEVPGQLGRRLAGHEKTAPRGGSVWGALDYATAARSDGDDVILMPMM